MTRFIFGAGWMLALGLLPTPAAVTSPPVMKPAAQTQTPDAVHRMAVSADGKHLALGFRFGSVMTADAATLKLRTPLPKTPREEPEDLAFSPDGRLLAVSFFQGKHNLWTVPEGALARTIDGGFLATALAFSPDGKRLATYTSSGIQWWDPATGANRGTVKLIGPGSNEASTVGRFSQDASTLVVAGPTDTNHSLYVWEMAAGKLRRQFPEQKELVTHLAVSAHGERLLTSDNRDLVRLWDVRAGRMLREWKATSLVGAVALSPDGNRVAFCGSPDPIVHVWDARAERETARLPGHGDGAWALLFAPDGKRLYTASGRVVKLWALPAL